MKRLIDGIAAGTGFVMVVAVAFAIAWAGDVLTVDKGGTPKFAVSDAGKITVGATESYVNLVVQNNSGTPTDKVDIAADVLTVEGIRLENVNLTVDIAVTGAGGKDATLTEDPNEWFFVWVVTNNDGTSVNGLFSESSTAPTLPAGYTKKRRVGSVRNASGSFLVGRQEGNKWLYNDPITDCRMLTSGVATSYTDVVATTVIPTTSRRGIWRVTSSADHNATEVNFTGRLRPNGSSGVSIITVPLYSQAVNIFVAMTIVADMDCDTNQTVEYKIDTVPSSGGVHVDVVGYYDRI